MQSLGETIAAVRKERKISQTELSQKLFVTRQTVSSWETGKTIPNYESLKNMSVLLEHDFMADYYNLVNSGCIISDGKNTDTKCTSDAETDKTGSSDDGEQGGSALAARCFSFFRKLLKDRSTRKVLIAALAVAVVAVALCISIPSLRRIPKANVTVVPEETELQLVQSDEFGGGQGWQTHFVFKNSSDVAFTPESIVAYYYEGDRLDDKIKLSYDEICDYMDRGKLARQDTPVSILFGTNHTYLTHIRVTIFGRDENGHEMRFDSPDVMLVK